MTPLVRTSIVTWVVLCSNNVIAVHIWEYQRYEGYHASLHAIQTDPEFAEFDSKLKQLITSKKTSLMQEFRFWPTTPPRQLGGVFELSPTLCTLAIYWNGRHTGRRDLQPGERSWKVWVHGSCKLGM